MKVVVVGAGVMGLSIAWRLARGGASVEVVDARGPGQGATQAAAGALWPSSPLLTGPLQTMHRESLRQFEAFAAEVAAAARLPVTYRRCGRIEIFHSAREAARAGAEAAASGGTMDVIDDATAREANPGLAPLAYGGMRCRETAEVRVGELVAGLAGACLNGGVQIHKARRTTGLAMQGERISAVETAAGPLSGDVYLVTAGAWTPQVSPVLSELAPLVPAKGQAMTVPMPAGHPVRTIIKSDPIYVIPWDEEVLLGATTEPEAGFDESVTERAQRELLEGAAEIVPALRGAKVLRHWAGLRPKNAKKPHDPVMGRHPVIGNLWICAGHYKTGIGMAPAASALMAGAILEGKVPAELGPFMPRKSA